MKPLEKYQQKFIELLKEAQEELGGPLKVSVSSSLKTEKLNNATSYPFVDNPTREYKCSITIGDNWL